MVEGDAVEGAGCASLATAYQSFDGAHLGGVDVACFLAGQEGFNVGIHLFDGFVAIVDKQLVEAVDKVHEACHLLVAHGNVSAGFVGNVHVVALLYQSANGAAHRDNVVVGVG